MTGWKNILIWQKKINRKSVETVEQKKRETNIPRQEDTFKMVDQLETAERKLQECADDEAKIVKTTA